MQPFYEIYHIYEALKGLPPPSFPNFLGSENISEIGNILFMRAGSFLNMVGTALRLKI
jgi:hypothetical protein